MTSTEPSWDIIRQQLTRALGHDLDETAWQALRSLSPEIAGELTWRVEALHPQWLCRGRSTFGPSVCLTKIACELLKSDEQYGEVLD